MRIPEDIDLLRDELCVLLPDVRFTMEPLPWAQRTWVRVECEEAPARVIHQILYDLMISVVELESPFECRYIETSRRPQGNTIKVSTQFCFVPFKHLEKTDGENEQQGS